MQRKKVIHNTDVSVVTFLFVDDNDSMIAVVKL